MKNAGEDVLREAREKFGSYHEELVELFGGDYEKDSRFEDAVRAVASGRAAWLVLADFRLTEGSG